MFGSTVLEVSLAVVFYFSLISLVCSAIAEALSRYLKVREKALYHRIGDLLGDERREAFYDHPQVKSLTPSRGGVRLELDSAPKGLSNSKAGGSRNHPLPNWIPADTFVAVVEDLERTTAPEEGAAQESIRLLSGIRADTWTEVRSHLTTWFETVMKDLSTRYGRTTQFVIFCVALVLASVWNLDTVEFSRRVWTDDSYREQIVAAAAAQAESKASKTRDPEARRQAIGDSIDLLEENSIPVGWSEAPTGVRGYTVKLLGILITALAASMGAPFWFNLLSRLVEMSRGKAGNKTSESPSKSKEIASTS